MPNLPAIILNPSGEFKISDAITGAHQLWRFPNISNGHESLKCLLYDPIYQDSNVRIHPIFTRLKGDFELIMLLNSFYEYCDMKLYMLQIFGGENRPIYPTVFRTFLIIPNEMLEYEYRNPVTGETHFLDWEGAGAFETLVKTTNRNEIVVPVNIKPRYTLMNIADGSMKYGGADKLADWRLNVSVEYEIEMPWYVYLRSDYLVENINFNITAMSYMGDNDKIIQNVNTFEDFLKEFNDGDLIETISKSYDTGLEPGVHNNLKSIEEIKESVVCEKSTWKKSAFFYYTFTSDDIQKLNNDEITDGFIISFRLNDDSKLYLLSKYGQLTINVDYVVTDINEKDSLIQFKNRENIENIWIVDDIIEIYTFLKI
jgi:hypothetical protein